MSRLNPPARALNPIPIEPETPLGIEQRKLQAVRVGRTYERTTSPTASTRTQAGGTAVAGTKVRGGGRISGSAGFIPESQPVRANP